MNNQGDGKLFDRTLFVYDEKTDTFRCPADKTLTRKQILKHKQPVQYAASAADCCQGPLKQQCTTADRRYLKRHLHESALQRMNQRATTEMMRLRPCTVEGPFPLLKWVIFGYPRFLLRGLGGAQVETSLPTMAYNFKTMIRVLGGGKLRELLA